MSGVAHILECVKKAGYKVTVQRRVIVETMAKAARPVTVAELTDELRPLLPETSQDTVYRNLRLLGELGLVVRIRSGTIYSDCFELVDERHHHLVCLGCGSVTCLPGWPINGWEPPADLVGDFRVTGYSFEVYGYCARCRRESRDK